METTKMGYIGSILGMYEEPSSLGEAPLKNDRTASLAYRYAGKCEMANPTARPIVAAVGNCPKIYNGYGRLGNPIPLIPKPQP